MGMWFGREREELRRVIGRYYGCGEDGNMGLAIYYDFGMRRGRNGVKGYMAG
jgi:hypothetical protein